LTRSFSGKSLDFGQQLGHLEGFAHEPIHPGIEHLSGQR
jgi:hypothetical protein